MTSDHIDTLHTERSKHTNRTPLRTPRTMRLRPRSSSPFFPFPALLTHPLCADPHIGVRFHDSIFVIVCESDDQSRQSNTIFESHVLHLRVYHSLVRCHHPVVVAVVGVFPTKQRCTRRRTHAGERGSPLSSPSREKTPRAYQRSRVARSTLCLNLGFISANRAQDLKKEARSEIQHDYFRSSAL